MPRAFPFDAEDMEAVGRKDCRVTLAQRVLVVDGLAETEQVLRAVLEPKGLEVDRIRGGDTGEFARQQLSAQRPPSVVVLHVEEGLEPIPSSEGWQDVPRILIGATKSGELPSVATVEHYLEKPFQYGELIRTIERLLAAANC
jgi:DNA-binding response OmpR family regulator